MNEKDVNEMKKFIEEEKAKRTKQFLEYLQRGISIYRVNLVAIPSIENGRIVAAIKIVPLD
jgi:hypothetical protein